VRDANALVVVDPGMVARRSLILDPLRELGVAPEAVTHAFLSHHHPDHTVDIALFPNPEVVDFCARCRDDLCSTMPATAITSRRTASCGRPRGLPRRMRPSWSRPMTVSTR
jgi:Metallo-beta-lactamase superfamily